MKKLLLLCLVGYLCLPTSTLLAQVADSPGADFLHRSVPQVSPEQGDTHRGGVTRSDTLPENSGLVDHSGQGQESESSSASVGVAYIYGEIVARQLADTVYMASYTHFLDENQQNPAPVSQQSALRRGNLFEGSYGKQVFEFTVPVTDSVSVFSLKLDRYPVLKNYLVAAGDSVKIRKQDHGSNFLWGCFKEF